MSLNVTVQALTVAGHPADTERGTGRASPGVERATAESGVHGFGRQEMSKPFVRSLCVACAAVCVLTMPTTALGQQVGATVYALDPGP